MHKFKREKHRDGVFFSHEGVYKKKKRDRRSINHVAQNHPRPGSSRSRGDSTASSAWRERERETRAFYIAKFSPLVKTVGYKKKEKNPSRRIELIDAWPTTSRELREQCGLLSPVSTSPLILQRNRSSVFAVPVADTYDPLS